MKKEGENMLIGITERGDAGVDFSWEDPIRNHEVDAAVLITKCITQKFLEKVLKLHQEGYKIIVHATCTGYGGTELEPNVPDFTTQLTMIKMLLDDGFPAEQIVLRIDPIFPTVNGMRAVRCVLFGRDPRIQRCRISILDEYPHVKERFRNHGWTPIYGNSFQASDEQLKYVAEQLKECEELFGFKGLTFETCAESKLVKIAKEIGCGSFIEERGCISEKDLEILGFDKTMIQDMKENPQNRKGCHCLSCKKELLSYKHPCTNGCVYCYWKN